MRGFAQWLARSLQAAAVTIVAVTVARIKLYLPCIRNSLKPSLAPAKQQTVESKRSITVFMETVNNDLYSLRPVRHHDDPARLRHHFLLWVKSMGAGRLPQP